MYSTGTGTNKIIFVCCLSSCTLYSTGTKDFFLSYYTYWIRIWISIMRDPLDMETDADPGTRYGSKYKNQSGSATLLGGRRQFWDCKHLTTGIWTGNPHFEYESRIRILDLHLSTFRSGSKGPLIMQIVSKHHQVYFRLFNSLFLHLDPDPHSECGSGSRRLN